DVLRNGYLRHNSQHSYRSTAVRFLGPSPAVYAAGVMDVLEHEGIVANTMVGTMGDEYLLMGEAGVKGELIQVVGTSSVDALPFVFATADEPLLGEEIFAGGAYLLRLPEHIGSLLAQDWMRLLLVGIILAGVLWRTVL
ncbi:MAG: DUF6754 domain-containing protein, partial [Chloroflexota bacterium]|nr:DUF6754 domain-containing protein [Chloroflexota bacterium]